MIETPNSVPSSAHRGGQIALLVFLVVFGLGAGYILWRQKFPTSPAPKNVVKTETNGSNENKTTNSDTTNTVANENTSHSANLSGEVTWSKPKTVAVPPVLQAYSDGYDPIHEQTTAAWQVGTVAKGKYTGDPVILLSFYDEGPVFMPTYYRFIQDGATYVFLTKNSDQVYDATSTFPKTVTIDATTALADLSFPKMLTGPSPRQRLVLDPSVNAQFSTTGLTKVFTDPIYGPVYTKQSTFSPYATDTSTSETYLSGTVFQTRNGFYLAAPDGSVVTYRLEVDILTDATNEFSSYTGVPDITWTDGSKNSTVYNLTAHGGCGSINYLNVITSDIVNPTADLQQVGTTSQGDPIYELKNSNSSILKAFYNGTVPMTNGTTTQGQKSYDAFLRDHPVIFWIDPFHRLVELTSSAYSPMAECGKPVIYLYPTQRTNIDVSLQPVGGFTVTEPAYHDGWHVVAEPNGQLTNRRDGRRYPYLFWEGRGGIYTPPARGFTVAQNDVHAFLISSLTTLGLRGQEITDFLAFWEPRMQDSPYYHVSFLGNREMDALAPLAITPRPDSVIRILMDFQPVATNIPMLPQRLTSPIRHGFTVVEWGGVLR